MLKNFVRAMMEADGAGGSSGEQNKEINIDYEKLSSLIAGKQSVAEDQVLKGFFKQQGMSKEDMDKAIKEFKDKKEAEKPNFEALTQELNAAKAAADNAAITAEAYKLAGGLGIDIKALDYVLKLADKSEVVVDGKVSSDKLTAALTKVLEDVPQFKKQEENNPGFKIGSDGGKKDEDKETALRKAMGL